MFFLKGNLHDTNYQRIEIDIQQELELVGLLARFYKGALTIPQMMQMCIEDIIEWFDIMNLQSVEEEVCIDLRYDDKGNKKELPPYWKIREIVNKRIADNKTKFEKDYQRYIEIMRARIEKIDG